MAQGMRNLALYDRKYGIMMFGLNGEFYYSFYGAAGNTFLMFELPRLPIATILLNDRRRYFET
jgi:hypothetical protein